MPFHNLSGITDIVLFRYTLIARLCTDELFARVIAALCLPRSLDILRLGYRSIISVFK